MEMISTLGIDLKLLLAQVVNFVLLLIILRAVLYKPILNLLDNRKKMIEKTVEDSKKMEDRLAKLEEDRKSVLSDASKKAMEIIETSKKEAEEERNQSLIKAKKEIAQLAERYRGQLSEEKEQMLKELKKEVAELVIASSAKIIKREFSKDDQHRLEEVIKDELHSVKHKK